jgi:hypothetical protein
MRRRWTCRHAMAGRGTTPAICGNTELRAAQQSSSSAWGAGAKGQCVSWKTSQAFYRPTYAAYDRVGGPKMVHAACWAHSRRRFVEAIKLNPQDVASTRIVAQMTRSDPRNRRFPSGTSASASGPFSSAKLNFNLANAGATSSPQSLQLNNVGNAALPISGIAITGGFTETNNCPPVLAVGQGCILNVAFAPTANGGSTGALTLTDSAYPGHQSIRLIGWAGPADFSIRYTCVRYSFCWRHSKLYASTGRVRWIQWRSAVELHGSARPSYLFVVS